MTPNELHSELDKRKLSNYGAANILGINPEHVWRLVKGHRRITDDRAELIRIRFEQYDNRRRAYA